MAPRYYRYPVVDIQERTAGGTFTGVAPVGGTVTQIAENLGRERYTAGCSACGEFDAIPGSGSSISQLSFVGLGTTRVVISLVDRDNVEYVAFDTTISGDNPTGFTWVPVREVAFFPGWKIRVRSTGALTANGRVALVQGRAWLQEMYV